MKFNAVKLFVICIFIINICITSGEETTNKKKGLVAAIGNVINKIKNIFDRKNSQLKKQVNDGVVEVEKFVAESAKQFHDKVVEVEQIVVDTVTHAVEEIKETAHIVSDAVEEILEKELNEIGDSLHESMEDVKDSKTDL